MSENALRDAQYETIYIINHFNSQHLSKVDNKFVNALFLLKISSKTSHNIIFEGKNDWYYEYLMSI